MRAPWFLALAVVAAALAACDGDDDGPTQVPYTDDGKVTVMTRNLYLGTELDALILAPDLTAFREATTAAWARAQSNDFRARAAELAQEIADTLPDLVGLQEVSLWRIQVPGDFGAPSSVPATTVAIDHLAILLDELQQRGLAYEAVPGATIELFDQEVPINASVATDVRLTDRQVILARQGIPVSNARAQPFADERLLPILILGTPLLVKRGWTAVDAQIGGRTVTLFNTHLESVNALPRIAQAAELAAIVAAASRPVILVGDLNSSPGTEAHAIMTASSPIGIGMGDVWTSAATGDGFTCCFAPDLSAPRATRDLDARIDYVLWQGDLEPEPGSVKVVGAADADRTQSGLWPSDHAGVVATFTFATGT
jgi:endonuclease/exonuclease/phosphatase family metal-dependent hydrolase